MVSDEQCEDERLKALARFDILDTPREEAFDRITRLIRKTLGVRIGRLGGEEFGILLPHTGREAAWHVAERVRTAIAKLRFDFGSELIKTTASFGVASLSRSIQGFEELMKCADTALYQAKALGRNRTVSWRGDDHEIKIPRRRVLKGGQILFNARSSTIDCTVRSISDEGAGIDVSEAIGVPKLFELAIRSDRFEKSCRVVARTDKHLEVEFC